MVGWGFGVTVGCAPNPPARSGSDTATRSSQPRAEGCFETDPEDMYRHVRLCLGSPEAPSGRFLLEDRMHVPDATLTRVYRGGYEVRGASLSLAAAERASHAHGEQLGESTKGDFEPVSLAIKGVMEGDGIRLDAVAGAFDGPVTLSPSR